MQRAARIVFSSHLAPGPCTRLGLQVPDHTGSWLGGPGNPSLASRRVEDKRPFYNRATNTIHFAMSLLYTRFAKHTIHCAKHTIHFATTTIHFAMTIVYGKLRHCCDDPVCPDPGLEADNKGRCHNGHLPAQYFQGLGQGRCE